jgi:deoxyribose-phosphate aldolase
VRLKYVSRAVSKVQGTPIGIACVVGFHEGTQSLDEKLREASQALEDGATELDIVLNRDLLKAGQYQQLFKELSALSALREGRPNVALKLIFETSQLSEKEIIATSVLAGHADFQYIKTSTGFCGRGASLADVQLMSRCAEYLYKQNKTVPKLLVKASGGIRDLQTALVMIEAGASRIGTSSGVKISEEAKEGIPATTKKTGDGADRSGDGY